jgi:hypothetical protein
MRHPSKMDTPDSSHKPASWGETQCVVSPRARTRSPPDRSSPDAGLQCRRWPYDCRGRRYVSTVMSSTPIPAAARLGRFRMALRYLGPNVFVAAVSRDQWDETAEAKCLSFAGRSSAGLPQSREGQAMALSPWAGSKTIPRDMPPLYVPGRLCRQPHKGVPLATLGDGGAWSRSLASSGNGPRATQGDRPWLPSQH